MAYNWSEISGGGASGEWFGMTDYSNFLKANQSDLGKAKADLDAAIASGDVKINPKAESAGVKFTDFLKGNADTKQSTLANQGNVWTGELDDAGNRITTKGGGSTKYTGGVDVLHNIAMGTKPVDLQSTAVWNTSAAAQEPIHNPFTGVKSFVDNAATSQTHTDTIKTQGEDIKTLEGNYTTLQGDYDILKGKYDSMGTQYNQLQKDVAQAAKDALKIKYTGSTQVRNPSAMGIQAAQGTPFRGSGMAGAAALARPNKGLKIKTLNV